MSLNRTLRKLERQWPKNVERAFWLGREEILMTNSIVLMDEISRLRKESNGGAGTTYGLHG